MGRFVYRVDFDLKSGRKGWREHHYFHRAVGREYGQIAEIGCYDAPYGYGSGHGTSRPLACNATEGWPR